MTKRALKQTVASSTPSGPGPRRGSTIDPPARHAGSVAPAKRGSAVSQEAEARRSRQRASPSAPTVTGALALASSSTLKRLSHSARSPGARRSVGSPVPLVSRKTPRRSPAGCRRQPPSVCAAFGLSTRLASSVSSFASLQRCLAPAHGVDRPRKHAKSDFRWHGDERVACNEAITGFAHGAMLGEERVRGVIECRPRPPEPLSRARERLRRQSEFCQRIAASAHPRAFESLIAVARIFHPGMPASVSVTASRALGMSSSGRSTATPDHTLS